MLRYIYITYTCTYIWTNGREIIPSTSWLFLTIQNVEPVAVPRDFMLVIQKKHGIKMLGIYKFNPKNNETTIEV